MVQCYAELIRKINQTLDWCAMLAHVAHAGARQEHNQKEPAIMELWSAIAVIQQAQTEERICLENFLLTVCRSCNDFQTSVPLLLGIAAIHADKAENRHERNRLLTIAFRLAPDNCELLSLIERRGWHDYQSPG
ncbi:MAG: hypothetical protein KC587_18120 [Nitrospira sp.]|nr:hypothetical protein [Nitrospira sp.]